MKTQLHLGLKVPLFVPITDAETPQGRSNARGHLFEQFVARVFQASGCKAPTKSTLNVSSNGYELDIATTLELTGERAIAECKAYSSNVSAEAVNTFYGKLATERLDEPTVHGWFVAFPGLTADGYQLARKIEAADRKFRLFDAESVFALLVDKEWINPREPTWPHSDRAVIISEHGLYLAAKRLDQSSRLPIGVHIWSAVASPPIEALKKLLTDSDYANGLPVTAEGESPIDHHAITSDNAQPLVRVASSSGDFDYQYPAAPRFFIGRKDLIAEAERTLGEFSSGVVVVLNAQSGWGKSSFALKLARLVEGLGGIALVLDSRTAASPSYVWTAVHELCALATSGNVLVTPADASFASLRSCIATLQASAMPHRVPLLLFFDQFENVFRDPRLTKEFRDLALAIRDVQHPIMVGFSWKTDLVGWTEKYPYQLRDEIRGAAQVFVIAPFGPTELGIILSRLAKAAAVPLSNDLRQRLREYSQGIPWLIKKLASHVLGELRGGKSEEALIAESLSIQRLFEQDLARLDPKQEATLRQIARDAPVQVADVLERVSPEVIQSLVDQRLLVRVGERLDTYWDTFRDFLVSGRVSLAETYTLRLDPASTSRLLRLVVASSKGMSAATAAHALKTSINTVFNIARDLRQLGVVALRNGVYVLAKGLVPNRVTEEQIRERVATSLQRHRLYQIVGEHLKKTGRALMISDVAIDLKRMFPAVTAKERVWLSYARVFARWFSYANLFDFRGKEIHAMSQASSTSLLLGRGGGRPKTFPQGHPGPAMQLLAMARGAKPSHRMTKAIADKARSDLVVLGLIDGRSPTPHGSKLVDHQGRVQRELLRQVLSNNLSSSTAFAALRERPRLHSSEVGELLRRAQGVSWARSTSSTAGKLLRAWGKYAGLEVQRPARVPRVSEARHSHPKAAQQGVAPDGRTRVRSPARR